MYKILAIDDEPDFLEALQKFVSECCGDSNHALNIHTSSLNCRAGIEAIQLAEKTSTPFDLVLLDQVMSGVSGLECLRMIRQRWPCLPVIILSAEAPQSLVQEWLKAGADDYLLKENIRLIHHIIESAITRRRAVLEIEAEKNRRIQNLDRMLKREGV